MAQGYYTLDEAARILGVSEDDLKLIARRGEVRSFQDRGTWRFRVQDIQEMARRRGMGSDPDLVLGESPPPKTNEPSSTEGSDVFSFSLGSEGDTGEHSSNFGNGKQPPVESSTGSDSDIKLVPDSGEQSAVSSADSDVKLGGTPAKEGSSKRRNQGPKDASQPDSGVRLVPMDSDSDLQLRDDSDEVNLGGSPPMSKSDSDIRLELDQEDDGPPSGHLTDEIDLDEERRRYEKEKGSKSGSKLKVSGKEGSSSPFELHSDVKLPSTGSTAYVPQSSLTDSSDFELTPAGESHSPLELGSDEFKQIHSGGDSALDDSDEVDVAGPTSGISLDNPVDSGISLEQESEGSDEFNLSKQPQGTAAQEEDVESSSEFELTLNTDDSSDEMAAVMGESSSEFELTLDTDDSSQDLEAAADSSEFELTIDPDDMAEAPDLSSDSEFELHLDDLDDVSSSSEFELTIDDDLAPAGGAKGRKDMDDVLETDLDVSDLGDESGSEVVALEEETDLLEGSDIDLDFGAEGLSEDESSSQVVTIDEEEFDDAGETVSQRAELDEGELLDEDFGELYDEEIEVGEEEGAEEEEEEPVARQPVGVAPSAPWGVVPVLMLMPCVGILLVVALMTFEIAQGMSGYQQEGMVTKWVSGILKSITG